MRALSINGLSLARSVVLANIRTIPPSPQGGALFAAPVFPRTGYGACMEWMLIVLGVGVLAALAIAGWLWARLGAERASGAARAERLGEAEREREAARTRADAAAGEVTALTVKVAELEAHADAMATQHAADLSSAEALHRERESALERREQSLKVELEDARRRMQETFKALAAESLAQSTQEFLKLAGERFRSQQQQGVSELDERKQGIEQMLKPIAEALKRTDEKLGAMEQKRAEAYGGLMEQVKQMATEGAALRGETSKLVRAIREPHVRGRYGEIQLRRVAELSGMQAYCDFSEQESQRDQDDRLLRPDMIVKLPGGRQVVVDAKANLKPYLDALEAPDAEHAEEALHAFADGIAEQAKKLASKGYWKHYEGSPEFVVMFVPGDQFVDAALAKRPDLLEYAASHRVLLASPSSLIALLHAVAVAYQEQRLAKEAGELRELGAQLHERFAAAMEHVAKLGGTLRSSVDHYNRFVGSYEQRLEPTLRKFEENGVKGPRDIPVVEVVSTATRDVRPVPSGGTSLSLE